MFTVKATVLGKEIVDAKLLMAAPHILARNRTLVTAMLDEAKMVTAGETPIGPGRFGYHGRDTLKVEVHSKGVKTSGELRGAVQLFWREYGTGTRYRGKQRKQFAVRLLTGQAGTGGERAWMTAHKAINATRRFIAFYYNGMANWWNSA